MNAIMLLTPTGQKPAAANKVGACGVLQFPLVINNGIYCQLLP
jgi:hypothetical protein